MNEDHVEGAGNQMKGSLKVAAGKVTGGSGLQSESKADTAAGRLQRAAGSAQFSVRGVADR